MVRRRAVTGGLASIVLLALPALSQTPTPTITSLQSAPQPLFACDDFSAASARGASRVRPRTSLPATPTNGNAITAGTPTANDGILIFINGSFSTDNNFESVTWMENGEPTFLNTYNQTNTQVVACVPQELGLYQSAGVASIFVTETPFDCECSGTNSNSLPFTVNPAMAASAPVPTGIVGIAYSQPFFSGGTPPYTFAANPRPPGLSPSANPATPPGGGILSGTPTMSGNFGVPGVTDSWANTLTSAETVNIFSRLVITTPSLLSGIVTVPYNAPLAATGGVPPYTWSAPLTGPGALPPNLSINASTGVISGTPTTAGTFSPVTINISDSAGQNNFATYTLVIHSLPSITTASLPSGVVGQAYNATVSATGGLSPYMWSARGLPPNLTINSSTGAISGTPTSVGSSTVVVTVTDAEQQSAPATYTLVINSLPIVTTTSLATGRVQTPYSATVTATNGVAPYTWSQTGLPTGLSINASTGVISGSPIVSGTFSVALTVADSNRQSGTATLPLQIIGTLMITNSGLPAGIVGQGYSIAVSVTGGVTPYTITAAGLPVGLGINTATGVISGTPASSGSSTVTVHVSDSGGSLGQTAQATFTLAINAPPPPPLQITTTSLGGGVVGQIYSGLIVASGGAGGYTFTASSGSLPPGVLLALAGQLYGTPTTPGTYNFTAQVTDSAGNTASRGFSIVITPGPLTITGAPTSPVPVNSSISVLFGATGGVMPYKIALTGSAPTGTTFANGLLSGTATAPGTFTFTITATDSQTPPATASQGFSITVTPAPIVITASLPGGQVGQAYSGQFSATGGAGGFKWTGTAGDGLTVSSSGGVSGTPTSVGTVSISVTVTDSNGTTATGSFSVTISPPTLVLGTTSLPTGALTSTYSVTLTASGGTPPYTFTATGLPNGLSISSTSATTAAITGTPSGIGSFTVSITVTDSNGVSTKTNLTLTINPAPLKITTTGITPPAVGTSFSVGFGATGGTPPYTWTATGLPTGVTLATNGTLSGTPASLGTFPIAVTVTDANGLMASETLNLVVALPSAPGVSFSGLPNNGTPGGQATTSVTFNAAYPVDVTVNLTLSFTPASGLPNDPNIQFATGGTTTSVTVKAGSTTSLTSVAIQTGTVQGVITITAQLIANGTDITPSPAPSHTIPIGAAAPTVSSVSVTTSSTGFTVTVIGFDPTRAITQATFTFTPASGSNLQTTSVTIPAQSLFSAWYQSSTSAQFGSQFSFSIPFTVTGNVSGIASVTVTLTNATGTSTGVSATI